MLHKSFSRCFGNCKIIYGWQTVFQPKELNKTKKSAARQRMYSRGG